MRKYNAILSTVITLLLIDHFVFGSLYLMGANVAVAKPIINLAAILIAVHAVISTVLTIKAVRVSVGPGSYFKENFDFWLRRITGVLILVLLFIHGHVMHGHDGMTEMGFVGKLANTLFPVVVCIHLIGNVRPLLIASGIRVKRTRVIIIKVIIVALCAFALLGVIMKAVSMEKGGPV